jgi:hypothetical protein
MPKSLKRKPPTPGLVFQRTYRKKNYTLTVVHDGQAIGYQVGKTVYASPSAAAKAITKFEVNGWLFWHIDN